MGAEKRFDTDDGEPILKTSFRLATGIPGPELRFRILFLPPLHCGIGFPVVGGDINAPLELVSQRNMLFRRVKTAPWTQSHVQLRPKSDNLIRLLGVGSQ
jgi:hypothetical protein